jgi:amidase
VVAVSDYDAVLSPLLTGPPPAIGSFKNPAMTIEDALERAFAFTPFTVVANLTGQPALTLPVGRDEAGMPLAVQLLGRPAGDASLLALGAALEQAVEKVAA